MDKYVLVTGAFGGLGKSVIKYLLSNDYRVIAIDKNIEEMAGVISIRCNITNREELENCYNVVKNNCNKLYAIINLVGMFLMDSVVEGDVNELKRIVDVNFFGTYQINQMFIPLLLNNVNSRIINCTSELAGYSAIPFNGFYTLPKVMLDNYSDTLRKELLYLNIKVVKVQAGSFSTNLLQNANSRYETLLNNTKYYKPQLIKLKKMMDNELQKNVNPDIFGKLILKIINKSKPKLCYRIKRSFKLRLMSMLPERLQDKIYKIVVK